MIKSVARLVSKLKDYFSVKYSKTIDCHPQVLWDLSPLKIPPLLLLPIQSYCAAMALFPESLHK